MGHSKHLSKKRYFLISSFLIGVAGCIAFIPLLILPFHFGLHSEIDIEKYKKIDEQDTHLSSRKWLNYAMKIVKQENMNPPAAARLYAYVTSVYADTLEKTNSDFQASSATRDIIHFLMPQYHEYTNTFFIQLHLTEEIIQPETGEIILAYQARMKADNYRVTVVPVINTPESNLWYVRDHNTDKGAMAGKWLTWIVEPTKTFFVPQPPKRNSIKDQLEMEMVKFATTFRTNADLDKIYFWHGSSGFIKGQNRDNITPAGVWQNILYREAASTKTNREYANLQKILAQSLADSFIYAWKVKYEYMTQRPSMKISNLNLAVADPPFPGYVSGHSTISETAQVVLTHLLPEKKTIWKLHSDDARNSRLLAGIHFDTDNQEGKNLGFAVGENIVTTLTSDTSLTSLQKPTTANASEIMDFFYLVALRTKLFYHAFMTLGYEKIASLQGRMHGAYTDIIKNSGIAPFEQAAGISWYDYDGDGLLDVLVVGTASGNKLYKNNGNETFIDVTTSSKIATQIASSGVFADFNNDGCADIYLSRGPIEEGDGEGYSDILQKNNCDGTFTDISEEAGIKDIKHSTGVAWADYDNDGYVDLYVTNYGIHLPKIEKYEPNVLYHNNGNGTFSDMTEAAGVMGNEDCFTKDFNFIYDRQTQKQSYQPIWFDFNNDNKIDLYITNDRGINVLYKNNGKGTFTNVTKEAGLCLRGTGMGVTVGDYNNDGFMDIYVTNVGINYLWKNNGNETFSEQGEISKIGHYAIGWGTNFLDYDNDGYEDLFITNGKVIGGLPMRLFRSDSKLYRNNGTHKFEEVSLKEGMKSIGSKTGSAVGDFNNDGAVDIIEIQTRLVKQTEKDTHHLFKNKNHQNNWITLQLIGTKSNRDSIGAKVKLTTNDLIQYKQVRHGSSFLSQDSPWLTFGVGKASIIKSIEIIWPSGSQKTLSNIKSNQKLVIKE